MSAKKRRRRKNTFGLCTIEVSSFALVCYFTSFHSYFLEKMVCGGCWKLATAVVVVIAALIYRIYQKLSRNHPIPNLDLNEFWGKGSKSDHKESTAITPFKISYSTETIDLLKRRLEDAGPFADPLEGVAFEYGFNSKRLVEILNYWKKDYIPKWQERQDFLNQFSHFKTQIQGLDIHYIHVKPKVTKDTKVFPLLLMHGWPGE